MTSDDKLPEREIASFEFELTDDPLPDRAHAEFYQWIGICIKEWAKIENQLFEICQSVLRGERRFTSIVYYRTPSIEGRISLADDLLRAVFAKKPGEHDDPQYVSWADIRNDMRGLLATRNLLAHSPIEIEINLVGTWGDDDTVSNVKPTTRFHVSTSPNEALRTNKRTRMEKAELPSHFEAVHAIWERLLAFRNTLKAPPSKPA